MSAQIAISDVAVRRPSGAIAREKLGEDTGALEDYSRVIELIPTLLKTYYYRADLRGDLGDREGAIEDFSSIVRLEPTQARAYLFRGGHYQRLRRLEEAAQDFEKALEVAPPEWRYEARARQNLEEVRRERQKRSRKDLK